MSSWSNSPQAPAPYPGQGWYRITGPAKALRVLLIIVMVALGLLIIAYAVRQGVQNSYDDGRSDLNSLDNADSFVGFAASLTGGLTIAIFVLTVVWQWRLAKNHERLGRPGTTFGPGWAIGGWFIPIANFILPFLQFRELWKGSDPAAPRHSYDWRNAKVSPVVWLWWGLFVAAYVVELATSYQVVVGTVTTIDTKSTGGSIAASACRIAAAAFFIVVIRRLTGRQEAAIAAASHSSTSVVGRPSGCRRGRPGAATGGPDGGLEGGPDRPRRVPLLGRHALDGARGDRRPDLLQPDRVRRPPTA